MANWDGTHSEDYAWFSGGTPAVPTTRDHANDS
jgi:hypothetical protein